MRHRGMARARPRCGGIGPLVEPLENRRLLTVALPAVGGSASVSGTVFEDFTGSGANSSSGGLGGWLVYADANANGKYDVGEPLTLTDSSGNYTLSGLSAGSYVIRDIPQGGWYSTAPAAGGRPVTLSDGQSLSGQDFGNARWGSISGTIFNDLNVDGVFEPGEPPLPGAQLYIDLNHDGVLDAGDPVAAADALGHYSFSNLRVGNYTVLPAPSGWQITRPATAGYFVSSGSSFTDDWGFTPLGIVRGVVYNDANQNGAFDDGENVFKGWTVYADLNHNGQLDPGEPSALSQTNGAYSLGLAPGAYTLREVPASGYLQHSPASGAWTVTVSAASSRDGLNFGNVDPSVLPTGSVSGNVFNDHDGSGTNPGYVGALSGWRVYADLNGNGRYDIGEPSAITDSIGNYTIDDIPTGAYTIRDVPSAGWYATVPADGSRAVDVQPGQAVVGQDFASAQEGSISGVIYNDLNADSTRESAEGGLAGFTLYLDLNLNHNYDAGDPTATTDASGRYIFKGLRIGHYETRWVPTTGWQVTTPGTGKYDITSGDKLQQDWGITQRGQILGLVYDDANGSTGLDPSDPRLDGATAYVDLNNNGVLDPGEPTAITANGGWFTFWLPAGTYHIRHIPAPGYVPEAVDEVVPVRLTAGGFAAGGWFPDVAAPGGASASISGTVFQAAPTRQTALAGWRVYLDTNNNGQYDDGEPTALTDNSGRYTISNLPAGAYTLREVLPDGWAADTPSAGARAVAVDAGQALTGQDFGNVVGAVGSVAGSVFADTNHNGLLDADEPPLAGVTVFLDLNGNGSIDPGEPTTVTGADGTYLFDGLVSGTYAVREILPDGYVRTAPLLSNAIVAVSASRIPSSGPVFADAPLASVRVDMALLLAFAQHYNQAGTLAQGDLNGDDKIDFADLLLISQSYGRSLAAAATRHS